MDPSELDRAEPADVQIERSWMLAWEEFKNGGNHRLAALLYQSASRPTALPQWLIINLAKLLDPTVDPYWEADPGNYERLILNRPNHIVKQSKKNEKFLTIALALADYMVKTGKKQEEAIEDLAKNLSCSARHIGDCIQATKIQFPLNETDGLDRSVLARKRKPLTEQFDLPEYYKIKSRASAVYRRAMAEIRSQPIRSAADVSSRHTSNHQAVKRKSTKPSKTSKAGISKKIT